MTSANTHLRGSAGHDLRTVMSAMALFDGIDPARLEDIARDFSETSVTEGKIVVEQGDPSRDFYLVLSGAMIGLLITEAGRQVSFTSMGPGTYFGELSALDGSPRSITVSAAKPSRIARMKVETFQAWLDREPRILRNLAIGLAHRTRLMNDRIIGLIVHDVETRVRMLLVRLAQEREQLMPEGVIQPAPTHEAMASFVGANREAVSRVVARLNKGGVISAKRQKVVINNVELLLEGL
jgi:CRP-like cAMP-binding protein